MKRFRAHSGFTLLELVLVMVIIAIALAAAAPKLRGWSRGRELHDAADQFVYFTRYARAQAVSDGVMYRLTIDSQTGTYQLAKQDALKFTPASSDFGEAQRLPDGYRIELLSTQGAAGSASTIDFYPSGRTQPLGVRITAANGDTMQVVCPSAAEDFGIPAVAQASQ